MISTGTYGRIDIFLGFLKIIKLLLISIFIKLYARQPPSHHHKKAFYGLKKYLLFSLYTCIHYVEKWLNIPWKRCDVHTVRFFNIWPFFNTMPERGILYFKIGFNCIEESCFRWKSLNWYVHTIFKSPIYIRNLFL